MSEDVERIVFVPVIHTDLDSVNNVRDIIERTKPDVVAVELDRTRYHQLINPPSGNLSSLDHVSGDSVSDLMNQIALLEQNLGQLTGSMVGDEMLAAIETGRKVEAKIALVDRPIESTAQALMQVPLSEIYKLTAMIPEATAEVEEDGPEDLMSLLRDGDNVEDLIASFRKEFPMLANVLIDQRDQYIARAIISILSDIEGKIVVVLGAGHLDGVKRSLTGLLERKSAS